MVARVSKSTKLISAGKMYLGRGKYLELATLRIRSLPQPSLIIIGAQKSGTTTLHGHLADHPQIYMSSIKEPGYFLEPSDRKFREEYDSANDIRQHLADNRLLWRMLEGYRGEEIVGESSTHYTKVPEHGAETPEKCRRLSPGVKFIYIMRNPFERMVSQYLHSVRVGYTSGHFNAVIREDPLYEAISLYGMQLGRFLDLFATDRFLLLTFEEFTSDVQHTMDRVWNFLQLRPRKCREQKKLNVSSNRNQFSPAELRFSKENYRYFHKSFSEDLRLLFDRTGFSTDAWDMSDGKWSVQNSEE